MLAFTGLGIGDLVRVLQLLILAVRVLVLLLRLLEDLFVLLLLEACRNIPTIVLFIESAHITG